MPVNENVAGGQSICSKLAADDGELACSVSAPSDLVHDEEFQKFDGFSR
jgi:hypothetical protein